MNTYLASCQEDIFNRPLDGRLGATVGVLHPKYRESPITAQNSRHDRFPPAANGWRTIHPMSDMTPQLQAKEEGLLT
jgi:hypothetical protein